MISKSDSQLANEYSFKDSSIVWISTRHFRNSPEMSRDSNFVLYALIIWRTASVCDMFWTSHRVMFSKFHSNQAEMVWSQDEKSMLNGTNVFPPEYPKKGCHCWKTIPHTRPMILWKETSGADVFQRMERTLQVVMKNQHGLSPSFTCLCQSHVIIQRQTNAKLVNVVAVL